MIRVLLWDIDNTLLDFPAAERLALQAAFRDFALGPCPEDRVGPVRRLKCGVLAAAGAGGDHQGGTAHPAVPGVFPAGGPPLPGPGGL